MATLHRYFPNWPELRIHESSAGWDKVSERLAKECSSYLCSQYDLNVPFGETAATSAPSGTYRSENLEAQTFPDEIFDLVVLQDVFEHIFRPDLAIKEIARTLTAGGAVIMTVPIIKQLDPSIRRAALVDGQVAHFLEPEYHGNPVGDEGSLVTIDWGYEIVSYLQHHSGLAFLMIKIDDIDRGIRAELNEVLIGFKRPIPNI
jgi:SAM-dependent methyltransferase